MENSFISLLQRRKSCRKFTDELLTAEDVSDILEAALLSPTSRNRRKWRFYITDNRMDMAKLSDAKEHGSEFLSDAAMAVAIACNDKEDDCWIEDCSIAAFNMQLAAESRNVGSCWCQIRDRMLSDGTSAETIVRGVLNIPDDERVLCVIGFGRKTNDNSQPKERELLWERIIIAGDSE